MLKIIDAAEEMLICACGRVYTYTRGKHNGHSRTKCNSCIANHRRARKKRICVAFKGGKCERCGYDKCMRALHFHHRDPAIKVFEIGTHVACSWKSLIAELDKCDLLCSNCHFEEEELREPIRPTGRTHV